MAAAMPIAPELESRALTWPEQARALVISDDAAFASAGELLKSIKALAREIEDTFGPHKKKASELHRGICAEENKAKAPLAEAESILKRSMATYHEAQERARRAEQMRLEAEARQREETRRLEEAAAVEAAGDPEEAERILVEKPPLPAYTPPPPVAKVQGVAMREEWSGEVTNLKALVDAIAAGSAPLSLVQINQPVLNGLAKSLKAELAYPGVRAVVRTNVAAGRR
jgi:hypothetical protein